MAKKKAVPSLYSRHLLSCPDHDLPSTDRVGETRKGVPVFRCVGVHPTNGVPSRMPHYFHAKIKTVPVA